MPLPDPYPRPERPSTRMVNPTRRTVISSLVGVAVGGGAVLATQTPTAKAAELDVDGLTVQGVTHESPDGMVSEVYADVTANYAIEATTTVSDLSLRLRAGRDNPDKDDSEIAAENVTIDAKQATDSASLSGPVTLASGFQIADFRPSEAGASVVVPVKLRLVAEIRDTYGESMATSEATTVSEVTVTQKEDVLDFSVGGTGELRVED